LRRISIKEHLLSRSTCWESKFEFINESLKSLAEDIGLEKKINYLKRQSRNSKARVGRK